LIVDEKMSAKPTQEVRYAGEKERYISPPLFAWENPDMRRYLGQIKACAIFTFLFFIAIFWMWIFRVIPSWPMSLFYYGAIYYIVIYPVISFINFAMSSTNSKELFVIFAAPLNLAVTIFSGYLVGITTYQLFACWFGHSTNPSCRDTQFWDIIVCGITWAFFMIALVAMFYYLAIVARLRNIKSIEVLYTRQ
jgi:hypothetical protein